jgi:molecular chaperone GrpE
MRIPIQYSAAPDIGRAASESHPTRLKLVEEEPVSSSPEEKGGVAKDTPKGDERLVKELDRALGENRRLSADFDNYRRHAEAKLEKAQTEATHTVLAELGDAVRSLELAMASAEDDPEAVREGISLVARGIKAIFDRHGLERIPTEGQPFDPRVHEAVLVEESEDLEKGTVVRELSPGFRTEERVVRPARVVVAG